MSHKILGLVLAIGWSIICAQPAAANAPPPNRHETAKLKPNAVSASFVVKTSDDGTTRLIIPRQFIVPADVDELNEPQGMLDSPGRMRTLLAGLALSLAAVSVVLVRRKRNNSRIVVAGLLLATSCFAVGIATADITVPGRERRSRPAPKLPTVVIEYTDGGEIVELYRGKDFPK